MKTRPTLSGVPASDGIAVGQARLLRRALIVTDRRIPPDLVAEEIDRLRKAVARSPGTARDGSGPLDAGAGLTAPQEGADEVRVAHVAHPRAHEQRGIDVVDVLRVQGRQLRPVHSWLEMVDRVVSVVEEYRVQHRSDEVPR